MGFLGERDFERTHRSQQDPSFDEMPECQNVSNQGELGGARNFRIKGKPRTFGEWLRRKDMSTIIPDSVLERNVLIKSARDCCGLELGIDSSREEVVVDGPTDLVTHIVPKLKAEARKLKEGEKEIKRLIDQEVLRGVGDSIKIK